MGKSSEIENLRKGFKSTGIYPVDRAIPIGKLPLYARPDSDINDNIGAEFKKYLEGIRTNDLQAVHRAKKFCLPITAGKSVSVEEVTEYYRNRESTTPSRGRVRTRGGRQKSTGRIRTLGVREIERTINASHGTTDQSEIDLPEETSVEQMLDYGDMTGDSEVQMLNANESEHEEHNDEVIIEFLEVEENMVNTCIYEVNDYVVVNYEGDKYPGQIVSTRDGQYFIRCMSKAGQNWKWPDKDDEIWYDKSAIHKKILPASIVPVSNRGVYQINDLQ